jgi:hypothetical protein
MSRPPRLLFPQTVTLLTTRVQQGLPFVHAPLMEMILWSALALAQDSHNLKIISFVIMGNHMHIIAKEHLLVSKALPVLGASYYFCACSDLSLLYEVYDFSSQAEV